MDSFHDEKYGEGRHGRREYPYNDRWDSSQIGWIAVLKKDLVKEGIVKENDENWKEMAKTLVATDVDIYDKCLRGEVYGYRLFKRSGEEWEEEDSCYGFIGDDIETNGIVDNVPGLYDVLEKGTFKVVNPRYVQSVYFE